MKKSVLLTIFLIFGFTPYTILSQSGWFFQDSHCTAYLSAVHFPATNTGFVAGGSGVLLRTTTGGDEWILQTIPQYSFRDIYFPSVNTGYVVAASGIIMKTTNSGINWFLLQSPTSSYLNGVFFVNNQTGYVVGYNGVMLKTTSGGEIWDEMVSNTTNRLTSVYFTDNNTGYATGQYGMLKKTTNAGVNWFDLPVALWNDLTSIFFRNEKTGYVTEYDGFIGKTTNAGLNWNTQQVGYTYFYPWYSIHFPDDNTGYISGQSGWQMKSTNAGLNWFFQVPNTFSNLEEIFFTSRDTGYTVGNNGVILKTVSGGVLIGIKKIENSVPDRYLLHQNYPNPFNPITKIKFEIPALQFISAGGIEVGIYVYDVLGREVTTLVDKKLQPGVYETHWNASLFNSGIYFCRMEAGSFADTKKMILIK